MPNMIFNDYQHLLVNNGQHRDDTTCAEFNPALTAPNSAPLIVCN
jgi:hypothetical protein